MSVTIEDTADRRAMEPGLRHFLRGLQVVCGPRQVTVEEKEADDAESEREG